MVQRVTFCFMDESWSFYPFGSQLSNARESGNHPGFLFKRLPVKRETKSDPPKQELTSVSGRNNFSNRLTLSCSGPSVFPLDGRVRSATKFRFKDVRSKSLSASFGKSPTDKNCGTTDSAGK